MHSEWCSPQWWGTEETWGQRLLIPTFILDYGCNVQCWKILIGVSLFKMPAQYCHAAVWSSKTLFAKVTIRYDIAPMEKKAIGLTLYFFHENMKRLRILWRNTFMCRVSDTHKNTHTHINIHARSPVVTPGVLVVTCQLWNPLKYSSLQSSESELPGNEQCHIGKQLALTLSVCTMDSQMHAETHSFSAFSALWHKLRKGTGMLAFKRHTECAALPFTRAHGAPPPHLKEYLCI